MTCVIGYLNGDMAYMGGDSAVVQEWYLSVRNEAKVFRRGSILMGGTGSIRMSQLLRYDLKIPTAENADIMRWMVTGFVPAVRKCLKDGGCLQTIDGVESVDGSFLVAAYGRLFEVCCDFQVADAVGPYAAVGCGRELAMGAMAAMAASHTKPRPRILNALKIAERFSAGVRGPFRILCAKQR